MISEVSLLEPKFYAAYRVWEEERDKSWIATSIVIMWYDWYGMWVLDALISGACGEGFGGVPGKDRLYIRS